MGGPHGDLKSCEADPYPHMTEMISFLPIALISRGRLSAYMGKTVVLERVHGEDCCVRSRASGGRVCGPQVCRRQGRGCPDWGMNLREAAGLSVSPPQGPLPRARHVRALNPNPNREDGPRGVPVHPWPQLRSSPLLRVLGVR